MLTRLIPTTDAMGRRHWVEVSAETAKALHAFDRAMRRREKLHRARLRVETDVKARRETRPRKERSAGVLKGYLNVEHETAYRVMQRVDPGNPWEGPRYTFTHLLGESPSWPPLSGDGIVDPESQGVWKWTGQGWACAFCGGAKLEVHQACLSCDRTGRD